MIPAWHTCIVIPARNEKDLLPRCLASISEARANLPAGITSDVVIVVDSSTDRTAAIAEQLVTEPGAIVVTDAGVVGTARQIAARTCLQRFSGPLSRCWLAHTDADCIVPEDWLVKQLYFADQGIKAIAGVVSVDTFREHASHVEARFHASYNVGPDGDHCHVHGANLGVRADLFEQAGGWQPLSTGEDHDLWNRLRKRSRHCISTGAVEVVTSGRRVGRAPSGFASVLTALGEAVA